VWSVHLELIGDEDRGGHHAGPKAVLVTGC
jgi:hypothetical protein